jgi:hypothetical protein
LEYGEAMQKPPGFVEYLLNYFKPRMTDEDIKKLAEEVSKQQLPFADADLKKIAHNILDLDRDADRLAVKVIKSRQFLIACIAIITVIGVGFGTLSWRIADNAKSSLQSTYKEVTNNIYTKSQEPTFSNIVVAVANTKGSNILFEQMYPVITNFEKEVDFIRKTVLAQNDDRAAYEQLVKYASDPSFKHNEDAAAVVDGIRASYYADQRSYLFFHGKLWCSLRRTYPTHTS